MGAFFSRDCPAPPPPPPPPLISRSPHAACALALLPLGVFAWTLRAFVGAWRLQLSKAGSHVFAAFWVLYFHVTHWAVLFYFGSESGASAHTDFSMNYVLTAIVPCIHFAAVFAQGALQVAACQMGPWKGHAHLMSAPLAVFATAFSYYSYSALQLNAAVPAAFGEGTLNLSHYFFWISSIMCQSFSMSQIARVEAPDRVAGNIPVQALLLTQLMLIGGALGSVRHPYPLLKWTGLFVSVASFYPLLYYSTWPVAQAQKHFRSLGTPTWRQFQAAQRYIWVCWHLFPLFWLLGPGGVAALTNQQMELAFVVGDVFAKFIPLSMYLSFLTN